MTKEQNTPPEPRKSLQQIAKERRETSEPIEVAPFKLQQFHDVAIAVLLEMHQYVDCGYTDPYGAPVDAYRLGVAIQRAMEHKQTGYCAHSPICKDFGTTIDPTNPPRFLKK